MIGIDTFSWFKIFNLFNSGWKIILTEIIENLPIFITHEVKKEFMYRFKDNMYILEKLTILPTLNNNFQYYLSKGFDPADASLLEYSHNKENLIVTEDHLMLEEGVTNRNNILHLGEFFGILFLNNHITRKELYHLIKTLRKIKNITIKKEKELLKLRQI